MSEYTDPWSAVKPGTDLMIAAVDPVGREAEVEQPVVELERTRVADAVILVADEDVEVRRRRDQLEVGRRLHLRIDLARIEGDHQPRLQERGRLDGEPAAA